MTGEDVSLFADCLLSSSGSSGIVVMQRSACRSTVERSASRSDLHELPHVSSSSAWKQHLLHSKAVLMSQLDLTV